MNATQPTMPSSARSIIITAAREAKSVVVVNDAMTFGSIAVIRNAHHAANDRYVRRISLLRICAISCSDGLERRRVGIGPVAAVLAAWRGSFWWCRGRDLNPHVLAHGGF